MSQISQEIASKRQYCPLPFVTKNPVILHLQEPRK